MGLVDRLEQDDDAFAPDAQAQYDLSTPSGTGAVLIRQLVAYCQIEVDLEVLDAGTVDEDAWAQMLGEVLSCFITED